MDMEILIYVRAREDRFLVKRDPVFKQRSYSVAQDFKNIEDNGDEDRCHEESQSSPHQPPIRLPHRIPVQKNA